MRTMLRKQRYAPTTCTFYWTVAFGWVFTGDCSTPEMRASALVSIYLACALFPGWTLF